MEGVDDCGLVGVRHSGVESADAPVYIWRFEDMDIWRTGDPETWTSGDQEMYRSGDVLTL